MIFSPTTAANLRAGTRIEYANILPVLRELSSVLNEHAQQCAIVLDRIGSVLRSVRRLIDAGHEVSELEALVEQCVQTCSTAEQSIEQKTMLAEVLDDLAVRYEDVALTNYECHGQLVGARRTLTRSVRATLIVVADHVTADQKRIDVFKKTHEVIGRVAALENIWTLKENVAKCQNAYDALAAEIAQHETIEQ
jgi:hypothetical protein